MDQASTHGESRSDGGSDSEYFSDDHSSGDEAQGSSNPESSQLATPRRGCAHYSRGCMLLSVCCNKWYFCRHCHDADEDNPCDEKFDRTAVQLIKCTACGCEQPPEQECDNCGGNFGKYFCKICRMYDDTDKKQFHCEGCGICRVGGRENFVHCNTCAMCYSSDAINNHKCIVNALHTDCPVCLEYLHDSRGDLHVPPCGHVLHKKCFKEMLVAGHVACPTCQRSLVNMSSYNDNLARQISETPMPEEYRNWAAGILCNDCQKRSTVPFHFYGHRCTCGSFNTAVVEGPSPPNLRAPDAPVEQVEAVAVAEAALAIERAMAEAADEAMGGTSADG